MPLSKQELDARIERTKKMGSWSRYEQMFFKYIRSEYLRGDAESCKGYIDDLRRKTELKLARIDELYINLFPEEFPALEERHGNPLR